MGSIERVGVVGCGLMGSGIVEVCARAGLEVVIAEASEELLASGLARIRTSLGRARASGKLAPQAHDAALERVHRTTALADLGDCGLVIEAISEQEEAKVELFASLDRIAGPSAILASNTSSIPIARLGAATSRPGSVVGLHFFNPVPVMPLVEVVASIRTDQATVEACEHFASSVLGKQTIRALDRAGFVVNSLLVPYLLAAVRMLEAGFASAEAIDAGMELGCAHPMGPLKLCDFIGVDTVKAIADSLYEELKDPSCASPPLLLRMVDAGLLGRKNGRGFYEYSNR